MPNVTGTWITPAEATDPSYWAMHLRQTVRFSEGMAELRQVPERIFLEVGPGRTLSTLTRKQKGVEQTIVCSLRHPQDNVSDVRFLLNTLGRLWLEGVQVNWWGFYTHEQRHRIPLPTYPFERKRYWVEPSKQTFAVAASSEPGFPEQAVEAPSLAQPTDTQRSWEQDEVAPRNDIEQKIADIWQNVLGLQQVSVYDNFFEVGGDSVVSVQVVALANQVGLKLTPQQLFEHPTIAALATVAQIVPTLQAEQGLVTGPVPLTPIQYEFLEQNLADTHHWHPTILLEIEQSLDPVLLEEALQHLLRHHDALRLTFSQQEAGWQQMNIDPKAVALVKHLDWTGLSEAAQKEAIEATAVELQAGLNLVSGPLISVVFVDGGTEEVTRLLWIIHTLVADSVSWRILLEDLQVAYQQLSQGQTVQLGPKTTSFKYWSECLQTYAKSTQVASEVDYWLSLSRQPFAELPVDHPAEANEVSVGTVSIALTDQETYSLLHEIPSVYKAQPEEVLLTALLQALTTGSEARSLLVNLESQGRAATNHADIDLSRTVGQFTTVFPIRLAIKQGASLGEALKTVKEQLRSVPNQGLGYGALRYLHGQQEVSEQLQKLQPEVSFSYLGERVQTLPMAAPASHITEEETSHNQAYSLKTIQPPRNSSSSLQAARPYLLEISGYITGDQLQVDWKYRENLHHRSTIRDWSQQFAQKLRSFIKAAQSPDPDSYTTSDFGAAKMSQKDLSKLLSQIHKSS
ncbi:MAG: hypothetical protein F6K42_18170 [Leptolyngbya sp. SIO1D8]|nr:hypothetical protein [Leptolyngbya sp. SIO1D8]